MLLFATILCVSAWAYTLFSIDPFTADTVSMAFFFSSLFLSLVGVGVVLNLCVRKLLFKDGNLVLHSAGAVFRESALCAAAIVTLALLRTTPYTTWWSIALVIVFFGGMEAFALSLKKIKRHSEYV